MTDAAIFAIIVAAVVLALATAIAVPVFYLEREACFNRAEEMQLEAKWRLVGGCFVQLPSGRFVNLDNIRFTEQGKILVEP